MLITRLPTSFGEAYATVDTDADSNAALVERLYAVLLGRQADGIGLMNAVHFLDSGGSPASLAEAMLASPEYAAGPGQLDDASFISAAYMAVLGRSAEPSGMDYHLDLLAQGASRAVVGLGIAASPEAADVHRSAHPDGIEVPDLAAMTVAALYDTAFNRLPDEEGLAFWTAALKSGSLTLDQIAEALAASDEFAALHEGQDDLAFVTALYANAFGREPDPEGLAGHLSQLGAGVTRGELVLAFAMSEEQAAGFALGVADGVDEGAGPALAVGARGVVGYYSMTNGEGVTAQETVITAAGATAVNILDLSIAELSTIGTLFVTNPSNDRFGAEYLDATARIAEWVGAGGTLILHDWHVTDAATILPGAGEVAFTRSFANGGQIDFARDDGPIANGAFGVLTDESLDGRNFSNHGHAALGTLPAGSEVIHTTSTPEEVVTFAYRHGEGTVIYSSIPLDAHLGNSDFATYAQNLISAVAADQIWS